MSKPTVCYHARRLGTPRLPSTTAYDWFEVQRYYDADHTVRECRARFGFANQTWHNAVKRGDLKPRARAMPPGGAARIGPHRDEPLQPQAPLAW